MHGLFLHKPAGLEKAGDSALESFRHVKPIPKLSETAFFCACRNFTKKRKHRRLLNLAEVKYSKEMDLMKFVRRQRFLTLSVLTLLKPD